MTDPSEPESHPNVPASHNRRRLRLHYEREGQHQHTVPAQALVTSLQHLQRIVHLLAKFHRGESLGRRARIPYDLERRFALVCQVPNAGSYALPIEIGDLTAQQLFENDIDDVSSTFCKISRSVSQGDVASIHRLVPDVSYLRSLIQEYKQIQPPPRHGVVCSIEDNDHNVLIDGFRFAEALPLLDSLADETNGHAAQGYITGTLIRMDFDKRHMLVKLLGGPTLNVTYSRDHEPYLADHPRDLLQLHGDVEFDDAGHPISIDRVDDISRVDETPIEVHEAVLSGSRYRAVPPLRFDVAFDRQDLLYDLTGDFDITLSAESRCELTSALTETLEMLWAEYAQENPEILSRKAQELRQDILARFSDIHGE